VLPVHGLYESIEASRHPCVAPFPTMPEVMHLDLCVCFATDTTGFSPLAACSETDQGSHHVPVILVFSLKSPFLCRPVLVLREADLTICFSSLPLDENGEVFPTAPENLWDGDGVFLRQHLCQREREKRLDTRALFPLVSKAVGVLKTTINATGEVDELVDIP